MNWLFPVVLLCGFSALGILMGFAWVDAKKRGKSPILVTLLVICFFPIGLLAWLLFRPDPPQSTPKFDLNNYRVQ
jgi:hypothetical protein